MVKPFTVSEMTCLKVTQDHQQCHPLLALLLVQPALVQCEGRYSSDRYM